MSTLDPRECVITLTEPYDCSITLAPRPDGRWVVTRLVVECPDGMSMSRISKIPLGWIETVEGGNLWRAEHGLPVI